ncbi:DNA mismatch repair endonuclease MutL [Pontiella sulfatireligans]|uniref:DNA mismatch repair protein MutL n=1 Tax=Pontiella sulfatireligans TaxID=2750658 RepID=A0A6C2UQC8_9BACT|nr:DNA mismatch repair endonuclease MutL [Pontiella sulfatireligans]VGO22279.1 DNA mismatch repair protein MutL [Pontiella sulfatireligans]
MQNKPVIQMLPDQVINKIAAGEVVERPASVMKELFENALDAGATQVDVDVIRGGQQLIAITDNGCGMGRDQALLSIERHATSKIRSEADIENIHTLGFRGEALAAISSVSRFTLITRPEEDLSGTEIQIAGGKMLSVEDIGCPVGTRMEIRNLFFNVPARRKFLRAEQTELSHIRQLFLVHALAHPETGMSLKVDERMVYNLPMAGKMEDRITELYNHGFFEQLLEIDHSDAEYKITGYAGLPQTGRKDRQDQYIFVNGRPAAAPVVYHALNEAYHSLIAKGRYPAVFLFIEMEPSLVDVNVHPTKKEVRFRRPNQLRDAVVAALNKALTFQTLEEEPPTSNFQLPTSPPPRPIRPKFETQKQMNEILVRPELIKGQKVEGRKSKETEHQTSNKELRTSNIERSTPSEEPLQVSRFTSQVSPAPAASPQSPWGWCRIVGKIGDNYVVLETEDGYVLMEPRAAHERVLFEKFMRAAHEHAVQKQGLLAPETVDLLPSDAQIVRENIADLQELGFGVSEFGGDTFIIDALPVYVQDGPAESLLVEIARELEKAGKKRGERELVQERIAQAACQTAVRTKDQLSDQEIEKLVADLAKTEMPYTSPRGRPTLIYTSFTELDRKFSRE